MMSKQKWLILLGLLVAYLLAGAGIFYNVESREEERKLENEHINKMHIERLFQELLRPDRNLREKEKELFVRLTDYCGEPVNKLMASVPEQGHWDFYHSLFFVITVVSTIGYGNLAPTTMFTRIFMIFYALIGIPLNGIVMVTLGGFFGTSFVKLYRRWKTSKMQYDTTRLGLISQIVLYLVPGFTFFIFLPAGIMVLFEGWPYDVAVYYCFVTLTTIGFGDYVAGVQNNTDFTVLSEWIYKMFLLVWVIIGLGYVVMILSFITQALQSKKLLEIEQAIRDNFKKTPVKIRHELRGLLQELFLFPVKRVYKGEFEYIPTKIERSLSCPDLTIDRNLNSPTMARKRAMSEAPRSFILHRIQSESELDKIDIKSTFQASEAVMQQREFIMKLFDALNDDPVDHPKGYEGFSDAEILASEKYGGSQWSLKSQKSQKAKRRRAISEVQAPKLQGYERYDNEFSWSDEVPITRQRNFSEPNSDIEKNHQSFFTRLRQKLMSSNNDDSKRIDVEKQSHGRRRSMFTTTEDNYLHQTSRGRASIMSVQEQESLLENTSLADIIRAFSALSSPEAIIPSAVEPKRKLGTASLTPPKTPQKLRRMGITSNLQQNRRNSLIPGSPVASQNERRRFSLRPLEENTSMVPLPPPYTPSSELPAVAPVQAINRKFSRNNPPSILVTPSPVQRQVNKRENSDLT